MLFPACGQIFCTYIYDAICADIKSHFNLRYAFGRRRYTVQMEPSKTFIVRGLLIFSFNGIVLASFILLAPTHFDEKSPRYFVVAPGYNDGTAGQY